MSDHSRGQTEKDPNWRVLRAAAKGKKKKIAFV